VEGFERDFAAFCGAEHCVGVALTTSTRASSRNILKLAVFRTHEREDW
jgi:hypothetical protein